MPVMFHVFVVAAALLMSTPALSQSSGFRGVARSGAARLGPGRLSSPRAGLGPRSNPILNPPGSLTPHQVLNPSGSLSTGQLLNPGSSLHRPRSGAPVALDVRNRRPVTASPAISRARIGHANPGTQLPPDGVSRVKHNALVGSFEQLATHLRDFQNGEPWVKYLSLAPADPASLQKLFVRMQRLSNDAAYAKVAQLPAFQDAHAALADFLAGQRSVNQVAQGT